MTEIIIPNPLINQDPLRDHAYRANGLYEQREFLRTARILPTDYPVVADVCAGDGGWARILTDHGWESGNITCIDWYRTETPLVTGVNWQYWDVDQLAWEILSGRPLPVAIMSYKNRFDLVFLVNGILTSRRHINAVCGFLVRPGGKVFA